MQKIRWQLHSVKLSFHPIRTKTPLCMYRQKVVMYSVSTVPTFADKLTLAFKFKISFSALSCPCVAAYVIAEYPSYRHIYVWIDCLLWTNAKFYSFIYPILKIEFTSINQWNRPIHNLQYQLHSDQHPRGLPNYEFYEYHFERQHLTAIRKNCCVTSHATSN